jgi:hypothetical protein
MSLVTAPPEVPAAPTGNSAAVEPTLATRWRRGSPDDQSDAQNHTQTDICYLAGALHPLTWSLNMQHGSSGCRMHRKLFSIALIGLGTWA